MAQGLTPTQLLSGSQIGLNATQKASAELILAMFSVSGLSTATAMAAVVNAYAESDLNPLARGDLVNGTYHSIGLHQLNDCSYNPSIAPTCGGYGMSVAERMNPVRNVARIIEVVQAVGGKLVNPTGFYSPELATADFTLYVEKPKDAGAKAQMRRGMAKKLFPKWAKVSAEKLPGIALPLTVRADITVRRDIPGGWLGVGLGVVMVGALVWIGSQR